MITTTLRRLAAPMLLAATAALTGCGGETARELARLDFEAPFEAPEGAALDREIVHDGEVSLHVFAQDQVLIPLLDALPSSVTSDSLAVSVWARTEVMQRAVSLRFVIEDVSGESRVLKLPLQDARRTTEWTPYRIVLPLLPEESPTRIGLSLLIPYPGKIWLDDLVLWDGAPPPEEPGS